jgi:hypothetical protein
VSRPPWALYWLLAHRPFANDAWLERWRTLKDELKLRVPR